MAITLDFRSDTVSKPTPGMRAAMAAAEVGDDCYADDPSVNSLEDRVAALLGKPAGLFVPSGTMANQLAVATHTRPGDAIVCPQNAHVLVHEDASPARLSGALPMTLGDRFGFTATQLLERIREDRWGWPPARLVWLENTLGLAGGLVWSADELGEIAALARGHKRALHLDGARLWNAHVASGASMADLASVADSVSVCLSKGLGAPVGSVLVGDAEFVQRARSLRHAFGGAMRQSGLLAAAGLYALEHNIDRLADDHRRAHVLWAGVKDLDCWRAQEPQTNIVLLTLEPGQDADRLCAPLRERGLLCYPNRFSEVRLVVHVGLDDAAIETAVKTIRATLG